VTYGYTDTSETDYYDRTTGRLVAAVASGVVMKKTTCISGPPSFTEPATCEEPYVKPLCGPPHWHDGTDFEEQ
jgi:hypothetical protein